ncbi:hypothetical protein DLJ46_13530 [Micromonospora globispora]|uniref:Uncharacterized protein n=1 Tax=Micromonospora globispora TaxID=1450148 RepID=A0A317K3Y9_9ACTN|nr:DUF2637 domain-containing protein [Micromonospora globispora]PWU47819.1 hypothetical protein DLJ46_13530 [Micromonospora globispora]RQW86890.1 hypothetical protein DKL51_26790 [Micromonospora globispora]
MNPTRFARDASTVAVASIAAWSSWRHMVHVALKFGDRPEVAYVLPISVDGMLIVASTAMLDDKRAGRPVRWSAPPSSPESAQASTLLASDVTSTIHGLDTAAASRAAFRAQFSQKRFSDTPDLPVVDRAEHGASSVGELFAKTTKTVPSLNQVRRVASGGGLRLVVEVPGKDQVAVPLADANTSLADLVAAHAPLVSQPAARTFLKCGRSLIEVR